MDKSIRDILLKQMTDYKLYELFETVIKEMNRRKNAEVLKQQQGKENETKKSLRNDRMG